MSGLTSTVPGAFNALYNLLSAAGAAQSPAIPVFHSEILKGQLTQNGYVLLNSVITDPYDIAALGSYAQYETYQIGGEVVFFQGGPDPTTMAEDTMDGAFALYESVVMATVIANRGQNQTPVLGSAAPTNLEWIRPGSVRYTGQPGSMAGGPAGFIGTVEFAFNLQARLTV